MCKALRTACLVVLTLLIAGCAGKDFVRPNQETFQLGRTTYAQVTQQMGEPRSVKELMLNDKLLRQAQYAYASRMAEEPVEEEIIPARMLQCTFHNDTLVGLVFLSTIKSDNTNFDTTKVAGIKKGETSRAAVVQMFGRPGGSFIPPMVKATSGEAVGYYYQAVRGNLLTGIKTSTKSLRISFDDKDIVSEVEYQSVGDGGAK